jgi:hypothetical protein
MGNERPPGLAWGQDLRRLPRQLDSPVFQLWQLGLSTSSRSVLEAPLFVIRISDAHGHGLFQLFRIYKVSWVGSSSLLVLMFPCAGYRH